MIYLTIRIGVKNVVMKSRQERTGENQVWLRGIAEDIGEQWRVTHN